MINNNNNNININRKNIEQQEQQNQKVQNSKESKKKQYLKWPTGSTPWFLGVLSNFCWISFFDPSTSFMRKGRNRGKKMGGKKGEKEKNDENSGHYIITNISAFSDPILIKL